MTIELIGMNGISKLLDMATAGIVCRPSEYREGAPNALANASQ
jgi:hypothetical protein